MFYHAKFAWMPGGFLGVEVFFVISGFLITGLLVKEHRETGRIHLGRFWVRRLRRLLPALVLFLFTMATVGAACLGARASQFRLDLPASFLYVENWYQIGTGASYFADQGLPLLRHLWSLAVEGQFYLVWPLLLAALARLGRGRRWPAVLAILVLAGASLGLGLALADPGNASAVKAMDSLNRVYLGTDTRALGLLAGALLAVLLAEAGPLVRWTGRMLDGAAWLALAGLALVMAWTDFQSPFLYRGGFLVVDALTAGVIAALVLRPRHGLGRLLGWRPLEWLGERSYGIYLWHWPVFRLLQPGQEEVPWFIARVALAVLLADLSYRWVERPVRQGALRRWLARPAAPVSFWRRYSARALGATLALAAALDSVALAERAPYVDPVQASLQAGAAALDLGPVRSAPSAPAGPTAAPAGPQAAPAGSPPPPVHALAPLPVLPVPDLEGLRVTAVGDSVMKGAAPALKKLGEASMGQGMVQINAEENRSFSRAIQVLKEYKDAEALGDVVVVHLGTNNSDIPADQFKRLMGLLADRKLVLFLTVKSDKTKACDTVNQALQTLAAGYGNARVLDWKGAAEAHPEFFYSDQTHLRPEGGQFYAQLILAELPAPAPGASARAE